ncbi:unnamed protein product [Cyprideis torosa]|uniref:Glutathione peroxidase n=1 Tax=Cyprideis torosa TaxID=163714 RepID=A0A7R8WD80_9CRUS|nr:unnamed protein product [Cyprideis torosa]CAG0888311.1 unnamed protein product [Cyprideis torosa]
MHERENEESALEGGSWDLGSSENRIEPTAKKAKHQASEHAELLASGWMMEQSPYAAMSQSENEQHHGSDHVEDKERGGEDVVCETSSRKRKDNFYDYLARSLDGKDIPGTESPDEESSESNEHESGGHDVPTPLEPFTKEGCLPSVQVKNFFELSAKKIDGVLCPMSAFRGKIILVVNTATESDVTGINFCEMNQLLARLSHVLVILAFPCNQFGRENQASSEEMQLILRHVRPGRNFEPKMVLFERIEVNGENGHPIFKFLKKRLPLPIDEPCLLADMRTPIDWAPVLRVDVAGNFEKFLISRDGQPCQRYSRSFPMKDLGPIIEELAQRRSDDH